jgi:hypothetical protein
MPKWERWGLVARHKGKNWLGDMVYHYRITSKASHWLERHAWRMPLERYFQEMKHQGRKQADNFRKVGKGY